MRRAPIKLINIKLILSLSFILYFVTTVSNWSKFQKTINADPAVKDDSGILLRPSNVVVDRNSQAATATTVTTNNQNQTNPLEDLSSVDYFACCGLGHRLVRMSLAHFVARQRNLSLRSFWGWCGERHPVEVFSYLFRPYPANEVAHVQSKHIIIPFHNEVPGFSAVVRKPTMSNLSQCRCHTDKIDADLELYLSLRRRFREASIVDDFVRHHFRNATVLGIHVRAGNGESGKVTTHIYINVMYHCIHHYHPHKSHPNHTN